VIKAIILAAGASSRMGSVKAVLPVGRSRETIIARVIRTIQLGGIAQVSVIVGAHAGTVRAAIPAASGVAIVEHPGWQAGQLSSLLAGLEAVDDPQLEALMVTPVDVPLVSPATVAVLVSEWRRTRASIVRPAQGERHGHPVIFDRTVFADLRAAEPSIGAKAVFAAHRDRIFNVEVPDAGAFEDMDTPEDYARLDLRDSAR
jgi:CTP:molybdopterin cytidylyltransferase MocA